MLEKIIIKSKDAGTHVLPACWRHRQQQSVVCIALDAGAGVMGDEAAVKG